MQRKFIQLFIIADVKTSIMEEDFLSNFNLFVNLKQYAYLSVSGTFSNKNWYLFQLNIFFNFLI